LRDAQQRPSTGKLYQQIREIEPAYAEIETDMLYRADDAAAASAATQRAPGVTHHPADV
jgi:hypothetical protein